MKRRFVAACFTLLGVILALPVQAKYDEKFFKKAAEKVWALDLPQFNPNADLSDSIFQNVSTVCIARYQQRTAEYQSDVNLSKYLNTGHASTSVITASRIYRVMMKLNDTKAVEDYTDFEIDAKDTEKISGYVYSESNTAFGARIYKPDGTVVNVDTKEAFAVTEGKKDKEVKRKLAIPGLAVGDVLEYFYYDEMYVDEMSLPTFHINLLSNIPTKNYAFVCEVSPMLTLEYASYNGAPLLTLMGDYNNKLNVVGFSIDDLPAIDTDIPYFYPRRQLPYVTVMIQNNNSAMVYHPRSARKGGVNLPSLQQILADAGNSIKDTHLPEVPLNRAVKIAKEWRKAHPDATERQYIDAAWMAISYVLATEDRVFSDRALSVYFVDMLKKLKISTPAYHALLSSKGNAPVNHLVSYNSAVYGTLVGDSVYAPWQINSLNPGQIPGLYAGEEMIYFSRRADHPYFLESAVTKRLPQSRPVLNTINNEVSASLDPDDMSLLDVNMKVSMKGAGKENLSMLIMKSDYYAAIEDYLGIPVGKRYKSKVDAEKLAEQYSRLSSALMEAIFDVKFHKTDDIKILELGCVPDRTTMVIELSGQAEGMVSDAGKNKIVSVGKLIGRQQTLTEAQRTREIEAILPHPVNERFHVTFSIPEGYTVSKESIEALNTSVNNNAGAFMSQAKMNAGDASVLEITAALQIRNSVYTAEQWPEVVDLFDGANAFLGRTVVLTPVK